MDTVMHHTEIVLIQEEASRAIYSNLVTPQSAGSLANNVLLLTPLVKLSIWHCRTQLSNYSGLYEDFTKYWIEIYLLLCQPIIIPQLI